MTPAQQSAQALHDQLQAASRTLRRCDCGSAVVMAYHPGATFIHCLREKKTVAASPDWSPDELAREWNTKKPASRYD
jgi:hypothetical protein